MGEGISDPEPVLGPRDCSQQPVFRGEELASLPEGVGSQVAAASCVMFLFLLIVLSLPLLSEM